MNISDLPIVRRPTRVNTLLQGPLMYPKNSEAWQQPVWGNTVRLYYGAQHRWDPEKKYTFVYKPGKRTNEITGEVTEEPRGANGTSYAALLEFVRACIVAGWTPNQVIDVLSTGEEQGPSALFRWEMVKRQGDLDWFSQEWTKITEQETNPKYVRQTLGNKPRLRKGLLPKVSESGSKDFSYEDDPEKLDALRRWVAHNPGLNQSEVKQRQTAFRDKKQVVRNLERLRELGLAHSENGRSTGGRPPKYWFAELTEQENRERTEDVRLTVEALQALIDGE